MPSARMLPLGLVILACAPGRILHGDDGAAAADTDPAADVAGRDVDSGKDVDAGMDVDSGQADEAGVTSEGESGATPDDDDLAELEQLPLELQAIVAGAIAVFMIDPADGTPHACPHLMGAAELSEATLTPSFAVDCNFGAEGHCIPADGGGGAGYYDSAVWTLNPVWVAIGFEKTTAHSFHYNFRAANQTTGYGACAFTAQAFGDLDGDTTLYSTYELRGTIDENGPLIEALLVDEPYE